MKMKRIFIFAFFAVFLLQGTLFACLNPSFKKVAITAVPMACCAKPCEKKTSKEEAQAICNLTAIQESHNGFIQTAKHSLDAPIIDFLPVSYKPSPFLSVAHASRNPDDLNHRRSLPLYLLSHTFLI